MTELLFKKNVLSEQVSILLAESKTKQFIVEEGFADFFNYGVTIRAIDKYFGGEDNLENLVKKELMKKHGTKDITKIDPLEIQKEIKHKADKVSGELASKEFVDGVRHVLVSGLINGIVNAAFRSLITLVITLSPAEAIKAMISGFIRGVLIEFLFQSIAKVYNEVKKRVLKDPYATPTPGEIIVLSILTISAWITVIGLSVGAGPGIIIANILISLFLSAMLTVLLNITNIGQKMYNFFNRFLGSNIDNLNVEKEMSKGLIAKTMTKV